MAKVGLTGSSGILGSSIYKIFKQQSFYIRKIYRDNVDFYNINTFFNALVDLDVVIHAAANTDVEDCEVHKDKCFRDNVLFTEMLSKVCLANKIKLVFISSTGIYGKEKDTPYTEFDIPNPTTTYHLSKHLAEQEVIKCLNYLILRVGWLFGGEYDQRKNFVARCIDEAKNTKNSIKANEQQFGSPTYCLDVARQILIFIERDVVGTFNCVNEGRVSRFEFIDEIYKLIELNVTLEKTSADYFQRKANVSNNESAINYKQNMIGMPKMRSWKEGLHDYIKNELLYKKEAIQHA